ncbi:STAS domain-containing protein [Aquihabitans daechungensis]|uniref:STAS domain-containing protein n=1 Tax=Aquihabitans daechungensis TaxID=1052257 RepID=UPI003BA01B39
MMTQQPFQVEVDRSGSHLRLVVEGEVDARTAPDLLDAFHEGNRPPAAIVQVDLSAVSFFDSSGLVALQRLHQQATATGDSFAIVDPSPSVERILQLTGLDQLLPIDRQRSPES